MTVTNRPTVKKIVKFLFTSPFGRRKEDCEATVTVMSRKNSVGDGDSTTQKYTLVALPDTVRATKKSSTPVASDTTAEKGAADKNKATTNRNLALKGKKAMLCAQPRHTLTRCGMHFRITQMGQCNGFRSRLWQSVRTTGGS